MKVVRIGGGAGYSGDRIEPAVELAERGDLDYLVFECLAERTIGLAQQARYHDPAGGYDPRLADRMRAVLPACRARGVTVVTNMGAANPIAAAAEVRRVASDLGVTRLRVAAVTGDDVIDVIRRGGFVVADTGEPVESLGDRLISANAYTGMAGIVEAIAQRADVVVTGRVADPSLFLGPLVHEFGWAADDWQRLGAGTVVGHLLECAGQVTGGYFADPGFKNVPDLGRLGFPIAAVSSDGSAVITKVAGSGGRVTLQTCKEQLLYEIQDPGAYLTPDVVADFGGVSFEEVEIDRVGVTGGRGRPSPSRLKVSLCYRDGFIGDGQISYAGSGAEARGRLAIDVVRQRLASTGVPVDELRCDLIGLNALHGDGRTSVEPYEVRVRVAGRTATAADAWRIASEVETLYTNGPAGGAGASSSVREVMAVTSTLIPRDLVQCHVRIEEV